MAVYTNLFTNPQPAVAGQWSQAASTTGVVTTALITNAAGPAGQLGRRITWTAANTVVGGGQAWSIGTNTAVTAGATYSVAVYVRSSKAQTIDPRIQWIDGASAVIQTDVGTGVACAANTWTEVKFEGVVAPGTATHIRCQAYATNVASVLWAVGDTLDAQAGTIVQSATLPQPFHGAITDDATHDYAWTGTADSSTSTLTIPDPNAAPTANAGADQSAVEPWWTVILTGSSSDSDGTVVARQWTQTSGPAVTLTGATTAAASFTAPGTLTGASLTFSYTVTDDDGATGTDMLTVTVLPAAERIMIGGVWVPAKVTIV